MHFLASHDEMNAIFMTKMNFLFIIYNFKRDRFFALIDIIDVHTLRHINERGSDKRVLLAF